MTSTKQTTTKDLHLSYLKREDYGPWAIYEDEEVEVNSCVYSDRLFQWNYDKMEELRKKHLDRGQGNLLDGVEIKNVENLLNEYYELEKVRIGKISKGINHGNGYNYFFIEYYSEKGSINTQKIEIEEKGKREKERRKREEKEMERLEKENERREKEKKEREDKENENVIENYYIKFDGGETIYENYSITLNTCDFSGRLYQWDEYKMQKLAKKHLDRKEDNLLDNVKVENVENLLNEYHGLKNVKVGRMVKGKKPNGLFYFVIEYNNGK